MVSNGDFDGVVSDLGLHHDCSATWRILPGVRQQIDKNLKDGVGVRNDKRKVLGHADFDRSLRVITGSRHSATDQGWQVSRAQIEPRVTTLHSLQVEELVDQISETATLVQHRFQILLSLGLCKFAAEQQLREADQARQRCSQLVADHRNQFVLCSLELPGGRDVMKDYHQANLGSV